MNWYWKHLIEYTQETNTCYTQLVAVKEVALRAAGILEAISAGTGSSADLISFCGGESCQNAAMWLYSAVNGDGACDLSSMVYDGYTFGGYGVGWKDQVITKSAYLLGVANIALQAESAYNYLTTQTLDSWLTVNHAFDAALADATSTISA